MIKNILKEFKVFALKGNAFDLAIGVVIGAAFGKIVSSLVSDIIMPPISSLLGGVDFSDKVIILKQATEMNPAIAWRYGSFITVIIDFLIIAFTIFIVVKQFNKIKRKEPEKAQSTKECPYCYSAIPVRATKCPNCTSALQ